MKLRIVTPLAVLVDDADIAALRAEDASGSFGILPGHAEFLTALAVSVLSWLKPGDTARHYCAVRRGVLAVTPDRNVEIATREAFLGDDLATLEDTVVKRFQADLETERNDRIESARMQISAIRHIMQHLRPNSRSTPGVAA
jgi:F-type H+-transporting ATPase subunit epsilon